MQTPKDPASMGHAAEARKPRVYIAGPYSRPDPCVNTHTAVGWGDRFWAAGIAPFIPHMTHFWHTMSPKPYEEWLDIDRQFLATCHAVFRFPGESTGADAECHLAETLGIPVFHDFDIAVDWLKGEARRCPT
jgi:hypothetical protein